MKEAVIVSTARPGIGRAYKGAFNNTNSPTLGGWAIDLGSGNSLTGSLHSGDGTLVCILGGCTFGV